MLCKSVMCVFYSSHLPMLCQHNLLPIDSLCRQSINSFPDTPTQLLETVLLQDDIKGRGNGDRSTVALCLMLVPVILFMAHFRPLVEETWYFFSSYLKYSQVATLVSLHLNSITGANVKNHYV